MGRFSFVKKLALFLGSLCLLMILLFVGWVFTSFVYAWSVPFDPKPAEKIFGPVVANDITSQSFIVKSDIGNASGFRPRWTNLFFTNHHVVESLCNGTHCKKVLIKFADEKKYSEYELEAQYCSSAMDICVLTPYGDSPTFKRTTSSTIQAGDPIYVFFHKGYDFDESEGMLSGTLKRDPGETFIEANISGEHGYSGSPVFDNKGNAVGIVSRLHSSNFAGYLLITPFLLLNGWAPANNVLAININYIYDILQNPKQKTYYEISQFFKYWSNESSQIQCSSLWDRIVVHNELRHFVEEFCLGVGLATVFDQNIKNICLEANIIAPNPKPEKAKLSFDEQIILKKFGALANTYFRYEHSEKECENLLNPISPDLL